MLGTRPSSRSMRLHAASIVSGSSLAAGSKATTALTNSFEPGGQSTGLVRHSDERCTAPLANAASRSIAVRTIATESPRLEPIPIRTRPAVEWYSPIPFGTLPALVIRRTGGSMKAAVLRQVNQPLGIEDIQH